MNYTYKLTKLLTTVFFSFTTILSFSQSVSINGSGTPPVASSVLDMSAVNNKGMLIPNISLTGTSDNTTVSSPANGLMIYNTATTTDVTPGYYYFEVPYGKD
ncbi:MAG: hypothetical protein GXO80_11900 [Chlorobi bacterium]|nr:hypothetical protein [Chlorobiota bacterium]